MISQAPIRFDRTTGAMEGATLIERGAARAFRAGSRIAGMFSYRGYGAGASLVRLMLHERDIAIRLNDDAVFAFPYGDGYWSKLLDRDFRYEIELERFFLSIADVGYTLIDCGANYGYWSVLASSAPYGAHKAIAIEPSSDTFAKLSTNASLNRNRFTAIRSAIGAVRGVARLSGSKHEALSIAGQSADGEEVQVLALDDLITDGWISATGRHVVKLDVEGVEIDAMKGGRVLVAGDAVVICEEHGSDRAHTVSRYIMEETGLTLFYYDETTRRFAKLKDIAVLDRVKTAQNIGYNVLATSSAFWEERILAASGH